MVNARCSEELPRPMIGQMRSRSAEGEVGSGRSFGRCACAGARQRAAVEGQHRQLDKTRQEDTIGQALETKLFTLWLGGACAQSGS